MALQKPADPTAAPLLLAERPEVPEEIPRGRGGRPKIRELIVAADGTMSESTVRFVSYTRASTLGNGVKNEFNLTRWKMRAVAFGLSRFPSLVLKAASAEGMEEKEDKDLLDEVAEEAKERAGAGDAAMSGTALHKLSERKDAGEDLSWLPEYAVQALEVYRRLMSAVKIVGSEGFVVCDELAAAGSYDRIVELPRDTSVRYLDVDGAEQVKVLPTGTRLILDLKTNKTTQFWGPEYLAQQVVYAHGVPYTNQGGRGHWPDGIQPSAEWALILHVPVMSAVDAGFYWVPLRAGKLVAQLANELRGWQNSADLFLPAELAPSAPEQDVITQDEARAIEARPAGPEPVGELPPEYTLEQKLLILIAEAADDEALGALWDSHAPIWGAEHTDAVKRRLAELAAAAEKPVQVRSLELMAALKAAPDEATMSQLWQENQEIWGDSHSAMAKEKAKEFGAAVAG